MTSTIDSSWATTGEPLPKPIASLKTALDAAITDIEQIQAACGIAGESGGDITTSALTATGSFTSPGIDDNADATAITIDSSENVGIGTPPDYAIVGFSSASPILEIEGIGTSQGPAIVLNASGSGMSPWAFATSSTGLHIRRADGASDVLFLSEGGDVGVGTSSPQNSLHVDAGTGGGLTLEADAAVDIDFRFSSAGVNKWNLAYDASEASMILYNNTLAATVMEWSAAGNVGIGISPNYVLDISANDFELLRIHRQNKTVGNAVLFSLSMDNSLDVSTIYGQIRGLVETNTNGAEGGKLEFHTVTGGVLSAKLSLDEGGNVYGKTGTTAMTDGFIFIPAAAGAPSGAVAYTTPTHAALYYDTTNKKLYAYNHVANAWEGVTLA